MINKTRNELINHEMDELLKDVIGGKKENLITVQGNVIYTLTTSDNQKNNKQKNESTIYLGDCENELKGHYNINTNETLLIFKIDIFENCSDNPIIEYEIYKSKTKEKLDLIYCKDTKIQINIPAKIDEKNEFKYNPSSDYYSDICFPYTTEHGTDINLNDRKIEFFDKNLSICELNCDYAGYDSNLEKVACECYVKIKIPFMSEIVFNKDLLKRKFVDIKNLINLNVMKCYSFLFTSEGLLFNIGSFILLAIIFLNIILLIVFIKKGYKNLFYKIYKIYKIYKGSIALKNKGPINNNNIIKTTGNSNIKKAAKGKKKNKKNNRDIKEPPNKNNGGNNNGSKSIKLNSSEIKVQLNISKKSINFKDSSRNNISLLNSDITQSSISKAHRKKIKLNYLKKKYQKFIFYSDYELNGLSYTEALKIDGRTYPQYYFSVLRMKYILAFTFFANNDYNSKSMKISLFLFIFSLYFTKLSIFQRFNHA